ncbi:phosphate ABC transporter substrate-binding protein [Alkalimonas collagenimarina]|uniref:Phosphate ABC transporter substrate-binding protein n=1 Tax=Alkalimonas collagenimarina TaxID=400390 RepID=A0ABT9H331_9GAMM|nr:phosphate ABC transporter substrate-binding protein [Alkalimonas collagenimarina]MDP4537697.1 phosphate ABC transporter substrate-binding protein [Alkalimonas collagenimarina]
MKKMLLGACMLGACLSWPLHAETVVIVVHPSNTADISTDELSRLYLGRTRTFSNGESAVPINLAENQPMRTVFDEKALSRSSAQLKAYWSKLVFTGKGSPPQEADTVDEMVKLVATNPSIIGYVPESAADDRVRIALRLE